MTGPSIAGAPVDVAVGVLIRDDGSFLLAERPEGKPMAGYWEFPGGKLEPGESVFDALVREFDEELGVRIVSAHPWVRRVVAYPHATVRLHFWRSFGDGRGWRGEPRSLEGQAFRWERIERLTTTPWLAGAEPVRRWMRLPATYAISDAAGMGVDAFLRRLDARLAEGALRQLQLREPSLDASAFERLFHAVRARCVEHAVRLLVNSRHDPRYRDLADGVHLSAADLARIEHRPAVDWCFASCHDPVELARAGELGLDAAVLGPVEVTRTHPGASGIGWACFSSLVHEAALPVYAIGGMRHRGLPRAIEAGAHGIAMIRGFWEGD